MFHVTFKVRGRYKNFRAETLDGLFEQWGCYRDTTGVGASGVTGGDVSEDGKGTIATMSYNGRVWSDREKFIEYAA